VISQKCPPLKKGDFTHRSISYGFSNDLISKGNGGVNICWNDAQVKESVSETLQGQRNAAPLMCRSKVPIPFDRLYNIEITWK